MSKTIDQRIVEMQFNNGQFEKNVNTSLSTLDKLKEALGFKDASKGFEDVTSASSGLGRGIETLQAKFSALDVMAVTALSNITNSAINLGKQLINTFAIEPLSTGFEEYELKMGSVQTIMAATGESLDTVNKYLQELNYYSDKTIYSFSDMTSNIGKFTNAGVKLEDAVMAIKGISNEAAVSGANANEASRAMYNFAQALSAGYVKLIDWKSIELANMATVEFKDQLLEAAAAAGTLEKTSDGMYKVLTKNLNGGTMKETIDATKNFNDSLSYQWMTTEVLVSTLKDYADETTDIGKKAYASAQDVKTFSMMMDTLKEAAQSGWSETWENVFGDFEEAKSLWTDLANTFGDMIQASADSRNALLSGGLSTGWKQLLDQGISDADAYKEAIIEAGKAQGVAVDEIIESTGSFADSLKEGWVTADILEEALSKLTDKTRGLSDEQLSEMGYTRDQIDSLEALEASVKDGSISLEDFADKMGRLSGRENIIESLKNALEGLSSILKPIKEGFREIFPAASAEQLYSFTEKLSELTAKFKMSDETAENLKSTFKGLFAVLDIAKQAISAIVKGFSTAVGYVLPFGDNILEVTAGIGEFIVKIDKAIEEMGIFNTIAQTAADIFGSITKFAGNAVKGVINFFKALKDGNSEDYSGFTEAFVNIGTKIVEMLGVLKDKIVEAVSNLDFDDVFNILSTGMLFVFIKKLKDFIDGLTDSLDEINIFGSVKELLNDVGDALKSWQENLKADTLIKLAEAVGILAAALFVISTIDSDKIAGSVAAITGLFADLTASMVLMEKLTGGTSSDTEGGIFSKLFGMFSGGNGDSKKMIAMAGAIVILAGALKIIAGIDSDKLEGAFMAITGLMVNMTAFMKIMESDGSKSVKGAAQMLIFAAALKVLASVCADLAALDWEELARGLTGVGALMAEVAAFTKLNNSSGSSISSGTGIVLLAAGLKILASACKDFAEMNWEQLAAGLTGVGGLLAEIGAFSKLTSDSKHMVSTGAALIEIAAAMKIMAGAFNDLKDMSWEEIARGLVTMGVALGEITVAVNLMPKNMLSVGSGLLVVSAAILVLSKALNSMGSMSPEEIEKGLVALGGALAELAIGLKVMTGTLAGSAAMAVAAGALALLVPIITALGSLSWEAIAKGLITLAGAFTIIGVAGYALAPITGVLLALTGAFALLGAGVLAIGLGIAALGAGLVSLAAGLAAFSALGNSVLLPIGTIITAFANGVIASIEALGEMVKALILTLVDVIIECAPALAEGALTLIYEVLVSLGEYAPQITTAFCDFLIGVFDALAEKIPELAESVKKVLSAIIDVFKDAVGDMSSEDVTNLIINLGLITALMFVLSGLSTIIPEAAAGVAGLGALIAELAIVLSAIGALSQIPGLEQLISDGGNLLEKIGTALGQFVGGLVGGIASGITGQLPGMATDLSLFMTNLQPFIEGASNIEASSMEGIKALAEALIMLTASELLNGITSWLTGGASLADFGEELNAFAPSFTSFANTVSGTDFSNVAVSAEALKDFCDAAKEIPNQGGVIALFTGDNALLDFADGLAAFGVSWKNYANTVAGVDFSGVKPSAEALEDFAAAAGEIPNSGGLAALFSGDNSLTDFGNGLQSFGKNLKTFADDTSDIDADFADNMENAANALTVFAKAAETSDKGKDLKAFGEKLEAFGVSFKTFCSSIRDSDYDSSGVSSAANVLSSIVDSAVTAVNEKMETFTTIGKTITEKLKGGIQAKASELVSAAKTVTERVITNVRSYYEKFKSAGVYLVDGFVQGIKAEKSKAIEASIELAKESLAAAKNELGIASPSKVFKDEVGAQLGAGLAEGIAASTGEAVEATEEMSEEVIKAAKEKYNNFKEWLSDEEFYGRVSTEDEIYAYQQAAEQFKDIPDISKEINKKIYTLQNEAAEEAKKAAEEAAKAREEQLKANYENAKTYCDKEQTYNRMNAEEYITYWENVLATTELRAEDAEKIEEDLYKKRHEYWEGNVELISEEIARQEELLKNYEEGSVEYGNILKEIAVLNGELAEAQQEVRETNYEEVKAYAEREQAFNRMNTEEYIAYWQNVLDTTELNADAVEEIEEDLYKKRHEYIEGSVELIDEEIERQNKLLEEYEEGSKEYEDTLKELTLLEKERAEAIKETAEALAEAEYNAATSAFSTEQDFGGMSGLLQQLDYYQQLLPKVVNDAEKYNSVLNKIYSITKKICDAQAEYNEEVSKVYAEAAEERAELTKQYYEDMTEIEEEYEEKREELEEEYADKVEEINEQLEEDIAELEEAYEDSLADRAQALYDAYGLFDEVSEKDEVSGSDLMQNLQDQIDEFKEWTELLDSLADRGMDEGLIEELQEMGVSSSIAELRALNDMTDSELEQYATLWAEKHQLATDRATAELEDLRTETNTQIAALQSEAAEELDEYVETWQAEMDELNQQMIEDLDDLRDEFKTSLRTITTNTQSQLQSLKSEFDSTMGLINENVEEEFNDMVNTVNQIIEDTNWESMGRQIVNGLINGVSSRQGAFANAMTNLIDIGVAAAQSAAEIQSPSKVFAEIGEYMVLGLVEGINGYSGLAEDASEDMAENVIGAVSESLSRIGELAEENIDLEPVISPVLDLDNVVNGVYAIDDLLKPVQSIRLGSAISLSNQNEYSEAAEFMEKMNASAVKSNESVVSAIEALQKDFGSLSNKIERLKIYMDTGTLVGAIAPDMDKTLGRRAKMSGRGVI